MENIIKVKNLRKSFADKLVVDNVSFEVKKKSLFAFLGQNGAGKTTTISMLIGLLTRESGEIYYDGVADLKSFKDKIGVVFQNNIMDSLLTVEENLLTYGNLYLSSSADVKKRLPEIVELLSMEGFLKQRFSTLSGGQKRKTEIARALFMSPEILFLDEPTTGLDPKTRSEFWDIIQRLKTEKGLAVFLTTHYMEETASADNAAIINKGRIAAAGSPAELRSKYTVDKLFLTPKDEALFKKQLNEMSVPFKITADTFEIEIKDTLYSIDLLQRLKDNIRFYELIKGSMDDVFLNVLGDSYEAEGNL